MMILRWFVKILLLPVTFALSLLVSMGRFLTYFSVGLLSVVSFVIFATAIASMALLGRHFTEIWQFFLCAWLLSPYGLPFFAGFLVELVNLVNQTIKSL